MPKKRPHGPPKRPKQKELTKKINVSLVQVKTGKASTGGKAGRTTRAGNSKEAAIIQDMAVGAAAAAADPPAMDSKVGTISKYVMNGPVVSALVEAKVA